MFSGLPPTLVDPSIMTVIEDEDAVPHLVVDPTTRMVENNIICNDAFAETWRNDNPSKLLVKAVGLAGIGWIYNEDGTFTNPNPVIEDEEEEEGSGG